MWGYRTSGVSLWLKGGTRVEEKGDRRGCILFSIYKFRDVWIVTCLIQPLFISHVIQLHPLCLVAIAKITIPYNTTQKRILEK